MANDPLGLNVPPPPSSASTKAKPQTTTGKSKTNADQPVGIPSTPTLNSDGTTSYTVRWAPGPGQDPPRVNADGTRGWYINNDIYRPATLDPAQVQQIQEQLVQAGLETAGEVHWGIWTTVDQNAYLQVLGYANQHSVDSTVALHELATHPSTPVVALDNPIDVSSVGDTVAQQILGRTLTLDEKANLTRAWNQQQTADAQANPVGVGASQVSEPSLTNFATNYEEQQNPGDFAHHNQTRVLGWLHSALGEYGSGGGSGN